MCKFENKKELKTTKIIERIIGTWILTFIILLASFLLLPEIGNYFNRIEFDSDKWKNWEETEETISMRWNMTHDLKNKYELIGMTKDDIISILGKPDYEGKNEISYFLGMSGYGIDTGSLTFKIKEGEIISYNIWHG